MMVNIALPLGLAVLQLILDAHEANPEMIGRLERASTCEMLRANR